MDLANKLLNNLRPSDLNRRFEYGNLNFPAYVIAVTHLLQTVNEKLNLGIAEEKLLLNAPFEWHPAQPNKKGILLIHGLFDTPFILRDVGQHFYQQGFLVRSILLPGHATVPADLLTTSSQEWIKATEYGIQSFAHEVDELYLVGFSTGATLELNYLLRHKTYPVKIAGLIMLSPALAINTTKSFLIRLYRMFRWLVKGQKWILKPEVQDYAKYTSFPVNAAFMLQRIIVENNLLEKKRTCDIPLFIAATADDETVQPKASLKLLRNTTNAKNRMIYYSNEPLTVTDPRINVVKSANPAENILSFSHVSIPISPDNPHYGRKGDYQESIYNPPHPDPEDKIYRGAFNAKHEHRYRLCRLTYNPLFAELMREIDAFIAATQAN